jgi:ribonuclease HI
MEQKTIIIYCDASFNKMHNVAVVGFAIFEGIKLHETTPLSELEIQFNVIDETNNIRAELQGAILALEHCPKMSNIILFSDCHAVTKLPERRAKLEKQNFISQGSGKKLSNADLYQKFYKLYDSFDLTIHWVKGHSANKNNDKIQANFSFLDQQIRKKLRSKINI